MPTGLSDTMAGYWVNFARTGNPNGKDLPDWPAFDAKTPGVMMLGDTIAPGQVPNQKQLDFWDAWFAKARAESIDLVTGRCDRPSEIDMRQGFDSGWVCRDMNSTDWRVAYTGKTGPNSLACLFEGADG